jgi:hypothetical protein
MKGYEEEKMGKDFLVYYRRGGYFFYGCLDDKPFV